MKSPAGWRSARAWLTSVRWPATARLLLGVVGLVLLILGAVKFAGAAGDTGPITLVVAGAVLLVVPFVLDRVQRGPAAAAPRLDPWITTQVSERGAPHTAAVLQRTRLGSLAEAAYRPQTFPFGYLDTLLMYTDGVIEARDQGGQFYPLARRAAAWTGRAPAELVADISADVRAFVPGWPADDLAMIAVRREEPAGCPQAA